MTVTVTNVERKPDGSPWAYGKVVVAIAGAAFDSNGTQILGSSAQQTDGSGAVSFTLSPGAYVWTSPDGSQTPFTVSGSGTVTLASAATAAAPYIPGSVTPAALAASIARVNLGIAALADPRYAGGLSESNTATQNDAVLAAAIDSGVQVLYAPEGTYLFAGHHSFSNQDLVGAGAGAGLTTVGRGTTFKATAAGAQFEFAAGGGMSAGFYVDGNHIATQPLKRSGGFGAAGRLFVGITTRNSAQDGFYGEAAQNDVFIQCTITDAARDLLWLDGGFGGASFIRCEIYNSGRYHLRTDATVDYTAFGVYGQPSDLVFDHCILEGSSGTSHVRINAGLEVNFRGTRFFAQTPPSGPLIDVVNGANISFDDPLFQIHNAASDTAYVPNSTGIYVRNQSIVSLTGEALWFNVQDCVAIDGPTVRVGDTAHHTHYFTGNRSRYYNGANAYQRAANLVGGIAVDRQTPTDPALAIYAYLQSALFFVLNGQGQMAWGDGTSFNTDTGLGRRAAGAVGVPAGTQQVIVTGVGTTAQRPAATTALAGALYVNTSTNHLDACTGTSWV